MREAAAQVFGRQIVEVLFDHVGQRLRLPAIRDPSRKAVTSAAGSLTLPSASVIGSRNKFGITVRA